MNGFRGEIMTGQRDNISLAVPRNDVRSTSSTCRDGHQDGIPPLKVGPYSGI